MFDRFASMTWEGEQEQSEALTLPELIDAACDSYDQEGSEEQRQLV